ncbi:putative membrane protein YgcG [Actinoplanes octamycinicus]|uniref:Putative membrane protein YgcG n=1 Tax=Actinoplanes octamycinicus TaxID=135948 RepID=A0A7W7GS21_9ACTN|nr:hypothetical protein [Actinoplanes octamycinicus]MBB4737228.1 putative membrane protein YgcG [Actinoplanes octamycinicus]GIE61952.1 hypothetical protein Aoc01nite_73540 [Actinoplanes octamycinicus]
MTRRWTSKAVVLTASFLALTACDAPPGEPSTATDVHAASDDEPEPEDFTVPATTKPATTKPATTKPAGTTAAVPVATDGPEVFYCADQDGVIVDPELCADDGVGDGAAYLFWHSPGYPRGLRPGRTLTGGDSFARDDADARAYYGLPATGVVRNGTTVKSNVVGRGSSGTGSGGTSSGGGGDTVTGGGTGSVGG